MSYMVPEKTQCLIRKRQGQGARSSEITESRQGGMSSFSCECNIIRESLGRL